MSCKNLYDRESESAGENESFRNRGVDSRSDRAANEPRARTSKILYFMIKWKEVRDTGLGNKTPRYNCKLRSIVLRDCERLQALLVPASGLLLRERNKTADYHDRCDVLGKEFKKNDSAETRTILFLLSSGLH